jgi:MinD superfamily P-loop ATPase
MCHSCGACSYFCPQKAITETTKEIGKLRSGVVDKGISFYDGTLNIGEISAVPLIKKVKEKADKERVNIIDSPPGTSCSMVETVKDSDYCILVTESTPFGLNDLKLAVDVVKSINTPFGVVINKYDATYEDPEKYLAENQIDILLRIPFDRKIAEAYSNGILPVNNSKEMKKEFIHLFELIRNKVDNDNGTQMTSIKLINTDFKSA